MKRTFHVEIVNKPFEDPVLFVRTIHTSYGMLFDLGNIDALEPGKLNLVSDIFVTHMHIDHFIGFDTVIRALLKRESPLSVFGPVGIINCVEGKLRGYTWNLIRGYPFRLEVYEIDQSIVRHASFYASQSFAPISHPPLAFENPIKKTPAFKVSALVLSHQIPVIAYCLEEDIHININRSILDQRGLPVGPWLTELKKAIREGKPDDFELKVGQCNHLLSELRDIVILTKGHKICYVMDVAPTQENISRLIPFIEGADTLYCEAFFSSSERERAMQRHHLTADIAGRMAKEAGVKRLVVMHFSQKHRSNPELLYQEAELAFNGQRTVV